MANACEVSACEVLASEEPARHHLTSQGVRPAVSSAREKGYEESGWPTYERCSAEQIKKVYLWDAKWKLVLDLGAGEGEAQL